MFNNLELLQSFESIALLFHTQNIRREAFRGLKCNLVSTGTPKIRSVLNARERQTKEAWSTLLGIHFSQ